MEECTHERDSGSRTPHPVHRGERAGPGQQSSRPQVGYGWRRGQAPSWWSIRGPMPSSTSSSIADLVRPAGGRFHPSLKRYYAGGTGKVTIWDTTDAAHPVPEDRHPRARQYRRISGLPHLSGSTTAIDGQVWMANIQDSTVYVARPTSRAPIPRHSMSLCRRRGPRAALPDASSRDPGRCG